MLYTLSPHLYTASQLTQQDVMELARRGVETIICHRPDNEEPDQPSYQTVAEWATQAGIKTTIYHPVTITTINPHDATHLNEILLSSTAPVAAYCRTGTRSSIIWAIMQHQQGISIESIMQHIQQCGLDLTTHQDRIQQLLQNQPSL